MHYYKRNLGDYAKKAGRLSMLQHGSYTLLIDACYDREQFPTLEQALEWTWASTTDEKEAVIFVLHKFFMLEDGVFVQKRIREELIAYHDKSDKNTRIAIDRETKRKETSTKRAPCVNASPPQEHEPPPNHKPLTNNHINTDFEKFYAAYPKKKSKSSALKAWDKLKPPIDDVLKAISWQTKSTEWTKDNGLFIKHPASYLNAGAWLDEPTKIISNKGLSL